MMVGLEAFAKAYNLQTIVAKDTNFQQTMGQRNGLAFVDIKMINSAYCSG